MNETFGGFLIVLALIALRFTVWALFNFLWGQALACGLLVLVFWEMAHALR